jgi:hypothetical protein
MHLIVFSDVADINNREAFRLYIKGKFLFAIVFYHSFVTAVGVNAIYQGFHWIIDYDV